MSAWFLIRQMLKIDLGAVPLPFTFSSIPRFVSLFCAADKGEAVRTTPDDAITVARNRFETGTVQDGDLAAAIADETPLLKRVAYPVHGGTPHTQHHCQELLRQFEGVGLRTVVGYHRA
jgi:hypothetical protein